jgi:DNA-binding GntR family transcriptional regulator
MLAERFDVSTSGVRAAMAILKDRGLVEFVPGVGMFVK